MSLVSIINQNEYVYEFPVHLGINMGPYSSFDDIYETDTSNSDDLYSYSEDQNTDFYTSLVQNCTLEELNMICDDYNTTTYNNKDNLRSVKNEMFDEPLEELQQRIPNSHLQCKDTENNYYNEILLRNSQRSTVIKYYRQEISTTKQIVKRSYKLWEFLRNLLMDTRTCPSLIKWDDPEEGTFKFVQSEKVAQLWGQRKKNHNMNYEKLSRAMRYYYRSKVLLPVIGKRLVYKFGPYATGWRTENPIL